ncbi:hypothetical protein JB92DRAFT_2224973 [Gautieria morchelliformis]|nr:hypothetical protein JB92DRAFT_2224973 [Gautieria morchelliformis]
MCIENRDAALTKHINKQLEHLWELARECTLTHCYELKPSKPEVEYGTCLAQFGVGEHNSHSPSKNDLSFFASFDKPELLSIHDKEVLLKLHLNSGHYISMDAQTRETQIFRDYTCIFRVLFEERTLRDEKTFKTTAVVLDFSKLTHSPNSTTDDVSGDNGRHHKSIITYLDKYYFPLLGEAGLDFFQAIPFYYPTAFEIPPAQYTIANSTNLAAVQILRTNIGLVEIAMTIIELINEFTTTRWYHYTEELRKEKFTSGERFMLVEARTVYERTAFHVFFGPPKLQLSGSDSATVYVKLRELHVYKDKSYKEESYKVYDWSLAFDVSVHRNVANSNFKFEFAKAAFNEKSSSFDSEVIEQDRLLHLRDVLVQYITKRYFHLTEFLHISRSGINVEVKGLVEDVHRQVEEDEKKNDDAEEQARERHDTNGKVTFVSEEFVDTTGLAGTKTVPEAVSVSESTEKSAHASSLQTTQMSSQLDISQHASQSGSVLTDTVVSIGKRAVDGKYPFSGADRGRATRRECAGRGEGRGVYQYPGGQESQRSRQCSSVKDGSGD